MSGEACHALEDIGTGELFVTEIDFNAMNEMSPDARFKHMLAIGHYDGVDPVLAAGYFPIEGTGKRRFRNRLFRFRPDLWGHEAVREVRPFGFTPGDHMHGLALAAKFPRLQVEGVIACLGSSALIHGRAHVITLFRHNEQRILRCRDLDNAFLSHWLYLGVQEILD